MGEVSIGRYCVYVYAQFLQFFVVVSNVTQFGRAYESKVSRVEEEDAPAASVSFSVISMNSPFLNAWFLKGLILVLIKDIYTSSVFSMRL